MQHAQLLERVRHIVRTKFTDLGVPSLEEFCETILVRDGYYCGRCFICGDYKAVWFIEEQLLKISCRHTGVIDTSPVQVEQWTTRAA